jgi:hypothetical protein
MESIRKLLAPLTDWLPPSVRDRVAVEFWWLIFLAAALLVLLILGRALRSLSRRRKRATDWDRDLRENLDECPLPVRPPGEQILSVYHLPARLRLVIVAPSGKDMQLDAIAVEKLLDRLIPGLGAVAANDRPRIRVWPAQMSYQGFAAAFHRCTPKREPEGAPSRWVLVAGRAQAGRQPVLLGLGLWADEPNTIGRVNLGPQQWLDVLRLRVREG